MRNNDNIQLSIIAPAHRPNLWQKFYNDIKTDLNFEIIFVGERNPDFKLPSNFKYIYSAVKPTQCAEIALREAKGELILWSSDDLTYSPYAFDIAYYTYKSYNNPKTMIALRFFEDGVESTENHYTWTGGYRLAPIGMMSKEFWTSLEGIDRNYVFYIWENDLVMQGYRAGGRLILCQDAMAYEPHLELHKLECNAEPYQASSNAFFRSCWENSRGVCSIFRNFPVEKFEDRDLLIKSQGNPGKWE